MNDRSPSPSPDRAVIRAQAAYWCSRMNGEDSAQCLTEFEEWLARSPLHRSIYSQYSELLSFADAIGMQASAADQPATILSEVEPPMPFLRDQQMEERKERRRPILTYAAALFIALTTPLLSVWLYSFTRVDELGKRAETLAHAHLQTPQGSIRTYRLKDGSRVTLDRMSVVEVSMTQDRRTLALLRGRARFEVAHEQRPFIVTAGNETIRALGTIFDVSMDTAKVVRVELLRGAVSVSSAGVKERDTRLLVHRLKAGEAISIVDGRARLEHKSGSRSESSTWPTGLTPFQGAPLQTVVDEANRYGAVKLRLGDPEMANLPVYGTLRLNQPKQLAGILANSLDLKVIDAGGEVILSPAK